MRLTLLLSVLAAAAPLAAQSAPNLQEAGPPRLFQAVPASQTSRLYEDEAAVRQRNVTVDVDLLSHIDANAGRTPEQLTFNLFDDVEWIGSFAYQEQVYDGGYVAVYGFDDDPYGHAFVAVKGQSIAATIRKDGLLYKVNCVNAGEHTVSEIDELRYAPCGNTTMPDGGIQPSGQAGSGGARGHQFTVDIMCPYTTSAKNTNGGQDGVLAIIILATFETNRQYANSDVWMRVNLVYAYELSYTEIGNEIDLRNKLQNNGDGFMDEVHTLRDEHGADIVNAIYDTGSYCGVAYGIMCVESNAFESSAFCVSRDSCSTGNYTFGHEMGHLMGLQHDRANTGGCSINAYCYGWRTTDNAYRTVMAYAPGTRIDYYSNPNKDAPNGLALGVAGSEENWRTLNEVVDTVYGWRFYKDYGRRLETTFASNNGFRGNMFDIEPERDIVVDGVGINCSAAAGTAVTVNVYYRSDSYVGHESSSSGWTLLSSGSGTSAGTDLSTFISLSNSRVFEAGQTYGMYVDLTSYGVGQSLRYTNGGPNVYANNDLTIISGVGKGDPAFTGSTFSYRAWNGRVYYDPADGEYEETTTFTSDNGFAGNMFDVTPKTDIRINSLDVNVGGTAGIVTVDVWRRTGSYVGHESSSSGWTYVGSDMRAAGAGQDNPTRVSIPGIELSEGVTYGFYVSLGSYGTGVGSQIMRYTNGNNAYDTSHMIIETGVGKGEGSFTGSTFASRTWNGALHYEIPGPELKASGMVAGGVGTLSVSGCTPFGKVFIGWSASGGGPTASIYGTVYMDAGWNDLPALTAGLFGTASLNVNVQPGTTGVQLWLHAIDWTSGNLTNPLTFVIG